MATMSEIVTITKDHLAEVLDERNLLKTLLLESKTVIEFYRDLEKINGAGIPVHSPVAQNFLDKIKDVI